MKTIHAIWKHGQIVPMEPIDWPEGTKLRIEPKEEPHPDQPEDDLSGDDPATIARWIAAYDALPPWRMSASEEAEWQVARREMNDYTVARMRKLSIEGRP